MEVPGESYSRNVLCALDFYIYALQFLFQKGFTTINFIYICNVGVPHIL